MRRLDTQILLDKLQDIDNRMSKLDAKLDVLFSGLQKLGEYFSHDIFKNESAELAGKTRVSL